jgi:G3E family GTPase
LNPDTRIPVVLLTGFLGAGKTTLLNFLLRHPAMTGTAVVINEYGAVGLDHHLVEQAEPDEVELIEGGCMCCTTRGRLAESLMNLFTKAQRKQIPSLRRVIIETTGLAEPGPILGQLFNSAQLHERFVVDSVVTLVDAVNGASTAEAIDIAQKQIAGADALLITKTDLVAPDAVEALRAKLAQMNPDADIHVPKKGAVPPDWLFTDGRRRPQRGLSPLILKADSLRLAPLVAGDDSADPWGESPAWDDIQTFSLIVEEPLPAWKFYGWLDFLRSLTGADLLRFKGIVNLEGQDQPRVVHAVQTTLHPPEELERWPSEDRRTRLVFITRGWGQETVRSTLAYLQDTPNHDPLLEP